jgi:hypothetical protein
MVGSSASGCRFARIGRSSRPCFHELANERSASSTGSKPSCKATTFYASLIDQFDVVCHFDVTRAVAPLERSSLWKWRSSR